MSKRPELQLAISSLNAARRRVIDIMGFDLTPIEHFDDEVTGVFDYDGYVKYLDNMSIVADIRAIEGELRDEFNEPRKTLGAVLDATGVKPATLRNWLTRKQIQLNADEEHIDEKWRLFSARDAVLIAVLHSLSSSGLSIADAVQIAEMLMPKLEDAAVKSTGLAGDLVLHFWKSGGEWNCGSVLDTSKGHISHSTLPPTTIAMRPNVILQHVLNSIENRENQ